MEQLLYCIQVRNEVARSVPIHMPMSQSFPIVYYFH